MLDWQAKDGFKPTRYFTVGEKVTVGHHQNAEILSVIDDCTYTVKCYGVTKKYGEDVAYEQISDFNWHDIFKLTLYESNLLQPELFRTEYQNRCIDGLLSMVIADYAGVDFNPDYQRGLVWSLEDKQLLIDSIFNHRSIGTFVLAKHKSTEKLYEIIDGKQRLTTLIEFYEDRFSYKGYYFSQLSMKDKSHFETNTQVSVGIIKNPSRQQKLQAFLAVNSRGVKVSDDVIAKVKLELDSGE